MHCFYHPDYTFPLPEEHPFPMDKFWRSEAMLREQCPNYVSTIVEAPAPEAWLLRVHSADYLERIRHGKLSSEERVKLGLPPGEALLTRSRLETAGTVAAMWAAREDGMACNLGGGTHHAFSDRGLGYCVLNDVAVAIRAWHARFPSSRVAVIDTDAHQGNGTHGIFSGDDRVFTFSIHVGRNYPADKTPGSLDVELPRYAPGEMYLEELAAGMKTLQQRFPQPALTFWIAGADPHEDDRFGQLRLTDRHLAERDLLVLEWTRCQGTPCVVLYGGGYNRDRIKTARIHADTVARVLAYHQPRSPQSEPSHRQSHPTA